MYRHLLVLHIHKLYTHFSISVCNHTHSLVFHVHVHSHQYHMYIYMYMYTPNGGCICTVEDIKKLTFCIRSTIVLWFVPFLRLRTVFTIVIVLTQSLRMRISIRNHMNAKYGRRC